MKLALGAAGAALLTLAGVAIWLGGGLLHDLQPRAQLTVKIDSDAVPQLVVQSLLATVRDGTREPRIGAASIAPSGEAIDVTLHEGVDRGQALARLQELSRQAAPAGDAKIERFTIVDMGGATLRLMLTPATLAQGRSRAADQTINVLAQRMNSLELAPTFKRADDDTIGIELRQPPDMTALKAFLVAPGRLAFRFVDTSVGVDEAKRGQMPPQSEILQDQSGTPYLVEKRIAMSGENLTDAQPSLDQRTNEPVVSFRFNAAVTRQFARITQQRVGVPLAVVLDGVVLAAPVIREPILGGSGQISGGFTLDSANKLAILLRSGALPLPLTIAER